MIDVTHGIARHDVRAARWCCAARCRTCRPGVHLAVVDPEVGRRAPGGRAALRGRATGCSSGPTTGCCRSAAERFGGAVEAVDIGRSPWRLEPVSATFHGRDIFAPVAAQLAPGRRSRTPASRRPRRAGRGSSCPGRESDDGVLVAHASGGRPLRQRHARRRARATSTGPGCASGGRWSWRSGGSAGEPSTRDVRRRRAGRAAALRGRLPHARAGRQPRRRGGAARRCATTPSCGSPAA